MTEALQTNAVVAAIGWAILQSLWQGAAIGAVTAAVLSMLRGSRASRRYVVASVGLLALIVVFFLTANSTLRDRPRHAAAADPQPTARPADALATAPARDVGIAAPDDAPSRTVTGWWTRDRLEAWSIWVVPVWLLGVLALSLRLAAGWMTVYRLRHIANRPLDDEWRSRVDRMVATMRIRRPVRIASSARVVAPIMIGALRPLILVPAQVLTGLPADQLEAVIAHELAHIRRQDYLVNLLQSVVEIVLFYHPVTHWLAARMRAEREHCCDDIAAAQCGDRLVYARALVGLEALRGQDAALVLAATDGSLLNRIRRLLSPPVPARTSPGWVIASALAIMLVMRVTVDGTSAMWMAQELDTASTKAAAAVEGRIRGQVIDAQSGLPLVGATVDILGDRDSGETAARGRRVYHQQTGPDGRYEVRVAPGAYLVSADAAGYVHTSFGPRTAMSPGEVVTVHAGQDIARVDIAAQRSGTISGRVLGDSGVGVSGVEVEVVQVTAGTDGPALMAIGFGQTEEGGTFRIADLPPGDYRVRAYVDSAIRPARAQPARAYAPTFYPATTHVEEAQPILLNTGQEVFDIDLTLAVERLRAIAGELIDPSGRSVAGSQIMLHTRASSGNDFSRFRAVADARGRFRLEGLVPDTYMLMVNDPTDYRRWLGSRRELRVEDDVTDLQVTATTTARVDGRFIGAGGTPLPFDVRDLTVFVQFRADTDKFDSGIGPVDGVVHADGTFTIDAPAGTSVFEISGVPARWTVRSVRLDGADVTDRQFELTTGAPRRAEIVLSDRLSSVAATVTDRSGRRMTTATVMVFPEDRSRRQSTRATRRVSFGSGGIYQFDQLPVGDYLAVAVDALPPDAVSDPTVLERLAAIAARFTLGEGQQKTVALRLTSVPAAIASR